MVGNKPGGEFLDVEVEGFFGKSVKRCKGISIIQYVDSLRLIRPVL